MEKTIEKLITALCETNQILRVIHADPATKSDQKAFIAERIVVNNITISKARESEAQNA